MSESCNNYSQISHLPTIVSKSHCMEDGVKKSLPFSLDMGDCKDRNGIGNGNGRASQTQLEYSYTVIMVHAKVLHLAIK